MLPLKVVSSVAGHCSKTYYYDYDYQKVNYDYQFGKGSLNKI